MCRETIYLMTLVVLLGLGLTSAANADAPDVGWWKLDEGSGTTAVDTVDCNSTAEYFVPLYESPEVLYGPHTLAVRVAGVKNSSSSGTEVIVDAFGYATEQFDTTPPAVPENFSAAAGSGSILLDWDDNTEEDFATYKIYRSAIQGSYDTPMDTLTASYYIDRTVTGGNTYYYVITAVDNFGNESAYSNEQSAPFYKGDLTIDGNVDLKDISELSFGWLLKYNTETLTNIADDWLSSNGLYFGGTTYYIDSIDGDDNHTGLNPQEAWKTLSKVNGTVFEPGDEIFLKAGTTYTGQLKPQGNGAEGWPIVVDQYGSGSKPIIDGSGYLAAVYLESIEYWELNNLEIVNNGGSLQEPEASGARYGVYVKAYDTGTRHYIYLRNLDVHNIFADVAAVGIGIGMETGGSVLKTNLEDILIENCAVRLTGSAGIWLHHKVWSNSSPYFAYNENIRILNNLLENIGGPGIQPNHCQQVLVEHNTVNASGAKVDSRQKGRGSGIWPWHCRDVLIQYNRFMHARGIGDSCGAHVDIESINTTVQYNLSYDNAGGFVEILGDCDNTIYRYNVSINDGWRIKGVDGAEQYGHMLWLSGWTGSGSPKRGPYNSYIYNNTIYLAPGLSTRISFQDTAENAFFRNNIFYVDGNVYDETPGSAATNMIFDYNLYTKALPATLPADANKIIADPLLANPGGLTDNDYMLLPGSPAINTGVLIPDNGGQDYWGNPLLNTPDRGVHERE